MFMRVLAPRRPYPVPAAGPALSLTAHAALIAAVRGGDGSGVGGPAARAVAAAPAAAGVERLHWIGVGEGSGSGASRPGARPPVAYVIPGRGGLRIVLSPGGAPGPGGAGAPGRRGPGDAAALPAPALRRAIPRRTSLAALPHVSLPDPDATLLVAGVLSAAPDRTQRVSRPEDFTPVPAKALMAELLVRSGITSLGVLRADVHVRDMPIPLASNRPPAYPATLEQARVGGQVVVEFLIDSTGAVDETTLRVVESTDERFTDAVRHVVPRLRFVPAQLGERAVGVTVRQPFLFTVRRAY